LRRGKKKDRQKELLDKFYHSRYPQKAEKIQKNENELKKLSSKALDLSDRLSEGKSTVKKITDYIVVPGGDLGMRITAIASLIYLISPLDFVPDTIPIIGYLEDFALLGMVAGNILTSTGKKVKETAVDTWEDLAGKIDVSVEKNMTKMIKTRLIIVGISLGGMCLAALITLLVKKYT